MKNLIETKEQLPKEAFSNDAIDWEYVSKELTLSENFIREFKNKVCWYDISKCQPLSESFIREFKDRVCWSYISQYQSLSGNFIREFIYEVDWSCISKYQSLSENFIREFIYEVDWFNISAYQSLSENFIREFKNKVCWYDISKCQPLSESFIREFKDRVCWSCISKYQSLSENFIKEFKLKEKYKKEISHNWHYKSNEKKLKLIRKLNAYEIKGNKIIAYKSTMKNGNSIFKPTLHYEVRKIYTSNANYNDLDNDGHGLSAWTKQGALEYWDNGNLYKVEIDINDVACITKNKKLRCTEIKIINEINK